jgi:hypothetical protein
LLSVSGAGRRAAASRTPSPKFLVFTQHHPETLVDASHFHQPIGETAIGCDLVEQEAAVEAPIPSDKVLRSPSIWATVSCRKSSERHLIAAAHYRARKCPPQDRGSEGFGRSHGPHGKAARRCTIGAGGGQAALIHVYRSAQLRRGVRFILEARRDLCAVGCIVRHGHFQPAEFVQHPQDRRMRLGQRGAQQCDRPQQLFALSPEVAAGQEC